MGGGYGRVLGSLNLSASFEEMKKVYAVGRRRKRKEKGCSNIPRSCRRTAEGSEQERSRRMEAG